MTIIGRKKEVQFLESILESQRAEFLAIYGRRRVGKTFLIREFFKNKDLYFEITGIKDAGKISQLKNFSIIFSEIFNQSIPTSPLKDWHDAFHLLRHAIEKYPNDKKIILFFDELPWLASRKSGFLEALDLFWNRFASTQSNLILIICGSAAEWMIRKIISNKAGLHNRLSKPPIHLKSFKLCQTEAYLNALGIHLDRKQIIDIYMALGGIPYYLNLIPKGKSSSEIISNLFFSDNAPLRFEFRNLFESLYEKPQKHIEVIKTLAQFPYGLKQNQLLKKVINLSPGGSAVVILEELESCGFITKILDFGKKKKDARYRLIDGFCLFYLKWAQGNTAFSDHYWQRKKTTPAFNSWSGYAFETLCLQHYPEILKALELTVVAEVKSSWQYIPPKNTEEKGAQIDLIIDRADKTINLCEMKFYDAEIQLSKTDVIHLKTKKTCFREHTNTKKTLFTTLISCYGVKKDSHYLEIIDSEVKMDDLFREMS